MSIGGGGGEAAEAARRRRRQGGKEMIGLRPMPGAQAAGLQRRSPAGAGKALISPPTIATFHPLVISTRKEKSLREAPVDDRGAHVQV